MVTQFFLSFIHRGIFICICYTESNAKNWYWGWIWFLDIVKIYKTQVYIRLIVLMITTKQFIHFPIKRKQFCVTEANYCVSVKGKWDSFITHFAKIIKLFFYVEHCFGKIKFKSVRIVVAIAYCHNLILKFVTGKYRNPDYIVSYRENVFWRIVWKCRLSPNL